ncbi:MAG: PleD family two-component system response regulator [bacterium]
MANNRLKILIVDDDFTSRRLIGRFIQSNWTCSIIDAQDGSQALGLMLKEAPDLVILDMMMPFMDGLQVLKTMRSNSRLAHIPVIACTAVDDKSTVVDIIKLGIDDYVIKPVDKKNLIKKISQLLKK